jgi:hypothetical protein
MTLLDTFEGVTVRETPDLSAPAEIYPLRPTHLLTGAQELALEVATDAAMRPLVESAWARRGVTVVWWSTEANPSILHAAPDEVLDRYDTLPGLVVDLMGEQVQVPGLVVDLMGEQVQVWGEAYDDLDTDAIWDRVIGNNYPRAWQSPGGTATLVITCGEWTWTAEGSGSDESGMLKEAVEAMVDGDWSPNDGDGWTAADDVEPFNAARWRGWVWTEVAV